MFTSVSFSRDDKVNGKDVLRAAKCVPKKALAKRSLGKFLIIITDEKDPNYLCIFRLNLVKKEEPKPEPEAEPLRRPENKGQGRGLLRSTIQARAARSPMPGRRLTTEPLCLGPSLLDLGKTAQEERTL